jgi:hypothetical protein
MDHDVLVPRERVDESSVDVLPHDVVEGQVSRHPEDVTGTDYVAAGHARQSCIVEVLF